VPVGVPIERPIERPIEVRAPREQAKGKT